MVKRYEKINAVTCSINDFIDEAVKEKDAHKLKVLHAFLSLKVRGIQREMNRIEREGR